MTSMERKFNEKLISTDPPVPGTFSYYSHKHVYPLMDGRVLVDLLDRMYAKTSVFPEDWRLMVNSDKLKGLVNLAVCNYFPKQFGSGFFLSGPFMMTQQLAGRLGAQPHFICKQCILFASTYRNFINELQDKIRFTAEMSVSTASHKNFFADDYQLLSTPYEPRYPAKALLWARLSKDPSQQAAGSSSSAASDTNSSGKPCDADFVIGIVLYNDTWFTSRFDTSEQPPYFYVPSAQPEQASAKPTQESLDNRNLYVATGYPCIPTLKHFGDVYGITDSKEPYKAQMQYQDIIMANRLSASAGTVMEVSDTQIMHMCSTGPGMSGGPLWPLLQHCVFVGIQRSFVLPVLAVIKMEWPKPYMLDELKQYLDRHKDLLQKHNLWSNAEEFFKSQDGDEQA